MNKELDKQSNRQPNKQPDKQPNKQSDKPAEHLIQTGIKNGLPILIGYFPIAIAFAMMAKQIGLDFWQVVSMSMLVYAGAAQFMAVGLLAAGVGVWPIIGTVFFINIRHLLMSSALANKLEPLPGWLKPIVGFGITDESFSVLAFYPGRLKPSYALTVEMLAYIGWVSGTAIGYLAGQFLPSPLQVSMKIGLYAMFVALLMPQVRRNIGILFLAIGAGLVNLGVRSLGIDAGISILLAIVFCAGLGTIGPSKQAKEG